MTISVFNFENIEQQPLHEIPRKEMSDPEAMLPSAPSLYCDDEVSEDEIDSQSSASSDDYEYDEELGFEDSHPSEAIDESPLRVTWAPVVVTDVRFRPRTSTEEKKALYYTNADQQRFRHEYKMQIRAVQKMRREQYQKSRQQQKVDSESSKKVEESTVVESEQYLLNNPLSSFINLMTNYLSRPTSSPQQQQQHNANQNARRTSSLETAVLVDTLYLF